MLALARQGKRHLATVLIGSGNGSLPISEAVSAWMRGVAQAMSGVDPSMETRLQRITFFELDPRRVLQIQNALLDAKKAGPRQDLRLDIQVYELEPNRVKTLGREAEEWSKAEWQADWERQKSGAGRTPEQNPARVTLSLENKTYRFGAITDSASMPEREIPLDPALVNQANEELAAEWQLERQLERGRFLEKLLVPADLRAT